MSTNNTPNKKIKRSRKLIIFVALVAALWGGGQLWEHFTGYPALESYLSDKFNEEEAYYGPVPSGEPGDPFNITTIEGDGWRMWDSGRGLLSGGGPFIWTGDKQFFFYGLNSPQFKSRREEEQNKGKMKNWFYYWDMDQGISPIKEIPVYANYCFSNNWLTWFGRGKKPVISVKLKEGRVVGERANTVKPEAKAGEYINYNSFECTRVISKKDRFPGHREYLLRKGDGMILYKLADRFSDHSPARLVNSDKKIDIELPFTNYDYATVCTRYFEFKQAYFIYDCIPRGQPSQEIVKKWKAENCLPAWWMWPDGKTEKLCIPYGPWAIRNDWSVMPTTRGLFITTLNENSMSDVGDAGGYLFRGGKLEKIVTGRLRILKHGQNAVSPDGCRVAFKYSPTWTRQSRIGIGYQSTRILDVCVDGAR